MTPQFGQRLSTEEYERLIVALHRDRPSMRSEDEEERLCRSELDLAIDYRLGRDFPPRRREALWRAQQKIQRSWVRSALVPLAVLIGFRSGMSAKLAHLVLTEYAHVLSRDELQAFLQVGPTDQR